MPMKNTQTLISKVQRLKDQGANGSPAYEFTTKIARVKEARPMLCNFFNSVTHWCNPSKAPPTYPEGKYNGRARQRKLALALVDSSGRLASEYKSDSWTKDEKRIRF